MSQVESKTEQGYPPYVPFPKELQLIDIEGQFAYSYISPQKMGKFISDLSEKVSLTNFDAVLVNSKGGWFLFNALAKLQNYQREPIEIEYHRPPEGYSADIVKPVPLHLRTTKNLVIDDVYDTAGVLQAIMDMAPNSSAAIAVKKREVPNQIFIPKVFVGVEVDNHWLGGVGMDLGPGYSETFTRNYSGILVKP